jgi:hypothetical protein
VWGDDEHTEFIDFIAANPHAGDVIPGATPLRKVRWTRSGSGKRGCVRVIYFVRRADGAVNLLIVYPKSKTKTLSKAFLAELRKLLE